MEIAILSFYSGLVSRGVETFVAELSRRVGADFKLRVFSKLPEDKSIKLFTQRVLGELSVNPPEILMPLNNGWMSFLAKSFCKKHKTKLVLAGFAGIGRIDAVNLWLFPDRFICCTQAQADWAKKINPWAKLSVIPIGVNLERFKSEGQKFKLNLKPPIILCVAGPEPYKQVNLAIQAVAKIGNCSLLVVGRQREEINDLGKKLLGGRYQNMLVDYQKLDQVYRAVDLFTLPSAANEAYGITILEAMASGLPVVVNDDPIRKELVAKAGILVDPKNIPLYTAALKNALKLGKADNYRQQALKFSWDNIVRQYETLWQSLS